LSGSVTSKRFSAQRYFQEWKVDFLFSRQTIANHMKTPGEILLFLGACANFAIALVHVGIVIVGSPAYLYFGAAGLADLAAQGSPIPALVTLTLAVLFVAWGLYALSGAGILPRLPWPRAALLIISFIYLGRGSLLLLDLAWLILGAGYPFRQFVFSAVSLVVGLVILVGVILRWRLIGLRRSPPEVRQ